MKLNRLIACLCLAWIGAAYAHGGEDHGDAPAVAIAADKPQRLPDGRVFVPKEAQRRWQVLTVIGQPQTLSRSVTLNAHVVMDPNAGGRVQAALPGRVEPGPNGLPVLGSAVRKGQILAYIVPAVGSLERASQQAERADLQARLKLTEAQQARLESLNGTVARKEIEAAANEVQALRQRSTALAAGAAREPLLAPATGMIASADAVSGQMVEAKDVLFEIVDPARMMIEALVYDPGMTRGLQQASIVGTDMTLDFVGGAGALRDGALPVLFRPRRNTADRLALGQIIKVVANTEDKVQGMPVPATSIVRNASNETAVWVHDSAELFRSVAVQVSPLDGQRVMVSGVKPGARIVTSGAVLINQIR
ncbi:Multidrug efflux pump subunit AcrA (membrane-fusion protein) [Andreprevotia lacus DSM 23236]|jgi:hypothetical protein|uniref:Multidrug efflux pump subunit AcrA (Membrane-fusion protein) n=1 Tax=Andreprevotia lacus DSM 23236 TaxID=1121001 RepID=A0A1W1XZL0_9NEIS|nr:HlyD family efflux transporter periplasmic adaptor subunit [Andreprevotia lacus]SMC29400.1 Multidrug efflux pump subunit AcrA (membrane-fusion protein) [Andreprevotia lacus DSM 23236]